MTNKEKYETIIKEKENLIFEIKNKLNDFENCKKNNTRTYEKFYDDYKRAITVLIKKFYKKLINLFILILYFFLL